VPIVLLPVLGVAAVALWWIESHKPKTTLTVTSPVLPAAPTFSMSAAHLLPIGATAAALLQPSRPTSPAPDPAAVAQLSICHAQWLLARVEAGVHDSAPLPVDLATCRAQTLVYQSIAQAKAAIARATQSPRSAGASASASASASTQLTLGVGGGPDDLAVAAVNTAMMRQMVGAGSGWSQSAPSQGDDASQVCSWAISSADSRTIRGLMGRYATRPDLVACLSQRLAQIEPFGL
jgi:hypothetical protein